MDINVAHSRPRTTTQVDRTTCCWVSREKDLNLTSISLTDRSPWPAGFGEIDLGRSRSRRGYHKVKISAEHNLSVQDFCKSVFRARHSPSLWITGIIRPHRLQRYEATTNIYCQADLAIRSLSKTSWEWRAIKIVRYRIGRSSRIGMSHRLQRACVVQHDLRVATWA